MVVISLSEIDLASAELYILQRAVTVQLCELS